MTKNNIINHAEGNSNTNNTNHCTDSVSSQQFCVRWNSHLGSLGAAFPQLLAGQRFVDVTLACEGHQLHCHRLVLAACSSYFESLLGENPCKHPIIILPRDIKLWEIQALVDFMYKGEVNVSQAGLSDLLKCAEILQIRGLSGTDSSVNLNQVGKESDFHINSPKLPQQQQEQKHNNNEMNDDKLFNQISGNSIQSSSLSAISNKNSTISQLLQIPKNKLVLSSLPSIVPSSSSIECIGQNINLSGQLLSNKTNTSSVQSLNQTNLNKNYLNMKDDLILNHQQDEKQQILPNQIEQSEKFNNQLRKILSENSTLFGQKNSKTIITNANNNFNNNNNNSNNNCWTNSKGNDYNNTNNNDSNINNSSIDIHLVNSLKRPSSKSNDSINNNKETINPYSTETQNSENNNDSNIINNNNNYKEETNNIINNNNNDKDKDENKNITNSKNDKEESNNITNANYDKDNYNSNSKIDNISNENDSNNINDDNRNNKNDNNINNDNNYNINNNNNEKDDNNNNSNKNDDYNNNKNDDDDNNNNDNNNSKNNNNDNPMEINFLTDNFENFKHNYNNDDHNNDLHEEEKRSLENSFNLAVAAVIAAASTSNLNKINKTINNNNILNVSCTNNIEEDLIDKNNDYINKINHNHKNNNNTQSLILKTEPMDTTSILEDETDDNSLCYNKIDGDDSDFLDSTIRSSDDVYDYDKNELRISMKNLPVGKKVRRSEAILRQAAECVSKGQTFQTVSDMFNIPISTIRFFMARKGILPRRKRGRSAGCSLIGSFNNNLTNELLSLAVSCGSGGITNTSIEDFQKLNTSPVTTTSLVTEVVASPSLSSSIMPSTAMHKISSKSIITTSVGTLLSTSISTSTLSSSSSSSSLGIENIKDNINIEGTNNIFNYNESKNNLKPENSQTEIPFNFINYKLPDIKPKLL